MSCIYNSPFEYCDYKKCHLLFHFLIKIVWIKLALRSPLMPLLKKKKKTKRMMHFQQQTPLSTQ